MSKMIIRSQKLKNAMKNEILGLSIISGSKMDEIIADAVYEAGGEIVNISEYRQEN